MQKPQYITVLFVKADSSLGFGSRVVEAMEVLVHPSDWGYHEVHAEIIIGNRGFSAVGRPPEDCVIRYSFEQSCAVQPFVECVEVPVTDIGEACRVMEEFSNTGATYDIPVLKFMTPSIFISDLDLHPDHWGHLFCSQFVLLCLREMALRGLIPLDPHKLKHLYDCPSVTCTPAHLRHILDRLLST